MQRPPQDGQAPPSRSENGGRVEEDGDTGCEADGPWAGVKVWGQEVSQAKGASRFKTGRMSVLGGSERVQVRGMMWSVTFRTKPPGHCVEMAVGAHQHEAAVGGWRGSRGSQADFRSGWSPWGPGAVSRWGA